MFPPFLPPFAQLQAANQILAEDKHLPMYPVRTLAFCKHAKEANVHAFRA